MAKIRNYWKSSQQPQRVEIMLENQGGRGDLQVGRRRCTHTEWAFNDVLVDPYPFTAIKKVWIDQNKKGYGSTKMPVMVYAVYQTQDLILNFFWFTNRLKLKPFNILAASCYFSKEPPC